MPLHVFVEERMVCVYVLQTGTPRLVWFCVGFAGCQFVAWVRVSMSQVLVVCGVRAAMAVTRQHTVESAEVGFRPCLYDRNTRPSRSHPLLFSDVI